MIPEGWVVIVGFNPFSLWGVTRLFADSKQPPWFVHSIAAYRLKHWLIREGFTIVDYRTVFFRLPVNSDKLLKRTLFMEAAGQMLGANFGATYLMIAKKSLLGMTLLKKNAGQKRIVVSDSYAH